MEVYVPIIREFGLPTLCTLVLLGVLMQSVREAKAIARDNTNKLDALTLLVVQNQAALVQLITVNSDRNFTELQKQTIFLAQVAHYFSGQTRASDVPRIADEIAKTEV